MTFTLFVLVLPPVVVLVGLGFLRVRNFITGVFTGGHPKGVRVPKHPPGGWWGVPVPQHSPPMVVGVEKTRTSPRGHALFCGGGVKKTGWLALAIQPSANSNPPGPTVGDLSHLVFQTQGWGFGVSPTRRVGLTKKNPPPPPNPPPYRHHAKKTKQWCAKNQTHTFLLSEEE